MMLSKLRGSIEKHVLAQWYQHTTWMRLLTPISYLFSLILMVRLAAYRKGWFETIKVASKVWVIGNVTVGGTGKTPFIAWLANALTAQGIRVGIITRGYGRRISKPTMVNADHDASVIGDEAAMLFRQVNCPIVVCQSRAKAARALHHEIFPQVILSDDGLQHYALERDLEIALINEGRTLGNRRLLPVGPLREPPVRLNLVDLVVEQVEKVESHPEEFSLCVRKIYQLNDPSTCLSEPSTLQAVCAIGYPEGFKRTLVNLGHRVELHPFADHYDFTAQDFAAFSDNDKIVLTEKDAVKCQQFADQRFWVCAVEVEPNRALRHWLETQVTQFNKE